MASDGLGKSRGRKSRPAKPYERPKGFIRRVADSVGSLFAGSWVSGWLKQDDEESVVGAAGAQDDAQPGPSGLAGSSMGAEATISRSHRLIYPEEGGASSPIATATTERSKGFCEARVPEVTARPPVSHFTPAMESPILPPPSPFSVGICIPPPTKSSTPAVSGLTKAHLESTNLGCRSFGRVSIDITGRWNESNRSFGSLVDTDVSAQPDEDSNYQAVSEVSWSSESRGGDRKETSARFFATDTHDDRSGSTFGPSPFGQARDQRKRPLEANESRNVSLLNESQQASGIGNRSSFFTDVQHGAPQTSAMASKRPRFSAATYGSPVISDRSLLSEDSMRESPYYPGKPNSPFYHGKTTYGGASAYSRLRMQSKPIRQTARTQVRVTPSSPLSGAPDERTDLGSMTRRIMDCLEMRTTPLSDTKRMPSPAPMGQRGSYLDEGLGGVPFSAASAFLRFQSDLKKKHGISAPPANKLLTPTRTLVEANMSAAMSSRHMATSATSQSNDISNQSVVESTSAGFFFGTQPSVQVSVAATLVPKQSHAEERAVSGTNLSDTSPSTFRGGGKMRTRVADSGRSRIELMESSSHMALPQVTLSMSSMPCIDLGPTSVAPPTGNHGTKNCGGFTFSSPEVIPSSVSTKGSNDAVVGTFSFRPPEMVVSKQSELMQTTQFSEVSTLTFNNGGAVSLCPKLKVQKSQTSLAPKVTSGLKQGSVLDLLKPNGGETMLVECSDVGKMQQYGHGASIDKEQQHAQKTVLPPAVAKVTAGSNNNNSWSCVCCRATNMTVTTKCATCSQPNGVHKNTTPVKVSESQAGFGDLFKKRAGEWSCDCCMLSNGADLSMCIACGSAKNGNGNVKPSNTSFGNGSTATLNSNFGGFGDSFKKKVGEWECDTCMTRNLANAENCVACQMSKSGAPMSSDAITGNFKFSSTSNVGNATPELPAFKFGVAAPPVVNNEKKALPVTTGFSFAASNSAVKPVVTGFTFGVASASCGTTAAPELPKFVVPASQSSGMAAKSVTVTDVNNMVAATPATVSFSFGKSIPVASLGNSTTSIPSEFKPSNALASGPLPLTNGGTSATSNFKFSFSGSENVTATQPAPGQFGNSKNLPITSSSILTKDSSTPIFSFGSNHSISKKNHEVPDSNTSSVLAFGAKQLDSIKTSFGNDAISVAPPTFSFTPTTVVNDNLKSVPFKTSEEENGGKAIKRPSFGANSGFTNTNGVVNPPSGGFSFFSTIPALPPSSVTPAFGDTAVAKLSPSGSSTFAHPTTPSGVFQFGAPAPTVVQNSFGGNSVFGSTPSNPAGAFVFGGQQSLIGGEKKRSVEFAPAMPASFNFGSAAPSLNQSNDPVFNFGPPSNASQTAATFTFGGPANSAAPVTFQSGMQPGVNIFDVAPSPNMTGRVIKRAARRTNK